MDALLLERDAELDAIAAVIAAAQSGSGGFVLVEAPAGMGKTSLLAEARSRAAHEGLQVFHARGTELERDFGFGLVRQLFERRYVTADEPADEPAAEAVQLLRSPVAASTAGDFGLLHALYWLTVNLCQRGPVVLVADDLHWADPASLRFLAFLLPRLDGLALAVIAGTRPREAGDRQHLIDLLVTDAATRVLRPAPLTERASARLVRSRLGPQAGIAFCRAGHRLASGNPLLLNELLTAAQAEGVPATTGGMAALEALAGDAIARRVAVQLSSFPAQATAVVRAAAVLDDQARVRDVVALAGVEAALAAQTIDRLAAAGILATGDRLGFVHPLIRLAVYRGLDAAERTRLHAAAADVLARAGARPQQIAEHLMRVPSPDQGTARVLRRAAADAAGSGAPEAALAYLRRCLSDVVDGDERRTLLTELGNIAIRVDLPAAVGYLTEAHELERRPPDRAKLAYLIGTVLYHLGRFGEATAVLRQAKAALPGGDTDLRCRMDAYILNMHAYGRRDVELTEDEREPWPAPSGTGPGAGLLDCAIATIDMMRCDPRAVARARRGLAGGALSERAQGEAPLHSGWLVLLAADRDEVMPMLDAAIGLGLRRGATRDVAQAYQLRSLGWLNRGHLAEAEADAREACRAIDTAGVDLGRQWTAPMLAFAHLEAGRPEPARAALDWARAPGGRARADANYRMLEALAHVLGLENRHEEALRTAVACGERAGEVNVVNPALVAWRSQAALSLHALGRVEEARETAAEQLELARRWGAPRAYGHALRVSGLVGDGGDGLAALEAAVDVLAGSSAQLEQAKARLGLGAALRRAGRRTQARHHLALGIDLAERCGAPTLVAAIRAELLASGGRARPAGPGGVEALTPSERRVAELASSGQTNREIAQALFVTPKTVEVHLSSAYRKLNVKNRTEMAAQLRPPPG
ncbi:helix-turn-helix transcriptional regulator [Dactylosporangium sp. CA-092794]|uniref:helix-turn-helix transcriptional regulator n=1 Tax=Dactylosporangium sp. CA-092794 TaxID=3239929 RepID=UPI003D9273D1